MFRALVIFCLVFAAFPALAGQSEVRETARINNCPPKKIEVTQNYPGSLGKTVYRVTCTLPKTTGEQKGGAEALLIECEQSLCALKRPIAENK